MKLTIDEFWEVIDSPDCKCIATDGWRHGTRKDYVFERDGKFWMVTVNCHSDEGIQVCGDHINCREVRPVERTVTEWEVVQ